MRRKKSNEEALWLRLDRLRISFDQYSLSIENMFSFAENIQVVGVCQTDTFGITAPGAQGSPLICGTNTGYHSEILIQYLLLYFFMHLISYFFSDP